MRATTTAAGLSLARGLGTDEFFLWNYLDESAAISASRQHVLDAAYLAAGAAGMFLAGEGFGQAQILLFILATGFPLLVFFAGMTLTGSFRVSILAGFFSIASGFYSVYWLNTESFLTFAWLGGLIICLSPRLGGGYRWTNALAIGVLCGLAHLTRADGILFLRARRISRAHRTFPERFRRVCGACWTVGAGYLLASGIWYARNLAVWGSLFPPGAGKAAWLVEYNDLFNFPSSIITMERFFSSGLSAILNARWAAFQDNLLTTPFRLGIGFSVSVCRFGAFFFFAESRKSGRRCFIF